MRMLANVSSQHGCLAPEGSYTEMLAFLPCSNRGQTRVESTGDRHALSRDAIASKRQWPARVPGT